MLGFGVFQYRMKYLLNLPLAVAALLQVWFSSLVFMSTPWSGWSDGPSRGAMVLVMLEPVALAWILLLAVIAASVFADAFDWLPIRRRWLQLTLVIGASLLIGILGIPCVLVAIGESCRRAKRGQTFRPGADRRRIDCGDGRATCRHGLARLADRRAAASAPRRVALDVLENAVQSSDLSEPPPIRIFETHRQMIELRAAQKLNAGFVDSGLCCFLFTPTSHVLWTGQPLAYPAVQKG
jgi:hypothetical protein